MKDAIFLFLIFAIIVILIFLAVYIGLAIIALHPNISLWFKIPAFIVDMVLSIFVGCLIYELKEPIQK